MMNVYCFFLLTLFLVTPWAPWVHIKQSSEVFSGGRFELNTIQQSESLDFVLPGCNGDDQDSHILRSLVIFLGG